MTALMKIQTFIQAYAQAISSILECDVTVVDNQLIRVAGTGNYAFEVGNTIAHAKFFHEILKTGKYGIITNAAEDPSCIGCEKRAYCKELADLAYPIFKDEIVVGVISIVAFEEGQRESLLKNRGKLEEFLKYMTMLLESKLYTAEARDRLEQQLQVVHDDKKGWSFVGKSQKMQEAIAIGCKVAKSGSTVFLRGESGTGKEIMAKMIHGLSQRRDKLMISINCAAIPENLVESELFGYEEGAFTGAKKKGAIGKFELADKSTIFLDEIGDMPLHVQTKLLRVLQENKLERIGGHKQIPIDIRVICATNKNIEQMVQEGTFREDLYYRLNIIPIELPPLRTRKEDIPPLVEHYIEYYNLKLSKHVQGVTGEVMQTLVNYNWPGNVRELKNIMEYLANIVESEEVQLSDLPDHIVLRSTKGYDAWSLDKIMDEYEKRVLSNLIKEDDSVEEKEKLAETLQISRATLYRKLKKHNLL
ncbi:sigma 54-interacting transcriptional regulator [Anaerotignum propionicum]|uniref:Formate hydrogenlyase transcriptional activator n=1 Tax=Anaerotignum propionicum DSM 1682 TaxID=991789 RepID=A0A110A757_ANAPI|nr:sigma 54-interacting transcriptional regulator [Anaerotignum propionicum]AMJ40556.1 formate hydrogenlyase transcriptional activator [Anaerotignum propionicum DSM 1682]SHE38980.1 Sigma-54 interaction domain-containing protein [[Clostridium] propionicum DSM 1682] [Anaerotignum propionicum DSM 1682]